MAIALNPERFLGILDTPTDSWFTFDSGEKLYGKAKCVGDQIEFVPDWQRFKRTYPWLAIPSDADLPEPIYFSLSPN